MTDKYILDAWGNPVPEPDLIKWGRWLQDSGDARVVRQEYVGKVKISTVFLGLDHSYSSSADKTPLIWETMVFGGPLDGEMGRCGGNRHNALSMHIRWVLKVRESRPWWRKFSDWMGW